MRPLADGHPGSYVLILRVRHDVDLPVGRLGVVRFDEGFYAYVGSALGPGGLHARLRHHASRTPRPHWHVDHLRRAADLLEAWVCVSGRRLEHRLARLLPRAVGVRPHLARFGSSDCSCETHLFFSRRKPSFRRFRHQILGPVALVRGSAVS